MRSFTLLSVLFVVSLYATGQTTEHFADENNTTWDFIIVTEGDIVGAKIKGITGDNIPENLVIPDIVKKGVEIFPVIYLGSSTFEGHRNVTSVTLPEKLIGIEDYTFWGNKKLNSVIMNSSLVSIGTWAFGDCPLQSISLPNSLKSIGSCAFENCVLLKSVVIPKSVSSIGDFAFAGCTNITTIQVEEGNSVYDSRDNCNAIIETATNKLVSGCKTSIIPSTVTSIGQYAFSYHSSLASIEIPNSVTSIEQRAFSDCAKLNSVIIPNSVLTIDEWAFLGCTGLTSIEIGTGVTKIGTGTFSGCTTLSDVYCYATKLPLTGSDVFSNLSATLHVPASAIDYYKSTEPWSSFGTIVTIDGGTPEVLQCATPTIAFKEGKLNFNCETEGVTYVYTITMKGASGESNIGLVDFGTIVSISVYAKKEGYLDSETVTKEIDLRGMIGDMNGDGEITVTDVGILITTILQAP